MKRLAAILIVLSGLSFGQSGGSGKQASKTLPDAPSASYTPLTNKERFKKFAIDTVHPISIAGAAVGAGIGTTADPYPEWGDGGEQFGKRFAAALADEASGHFFKNLIFPIILRTDPRYFREGKGSNGHRIGYAVSRVFVTRADSGKNVFNASEFLGAASSAALSTTYYPRSGAGTSDAVRRGGLGIGIDMGLNVFHEYWPEIKRKLRH